MKQEILYNGRPALLVTSNFQAPQVWISDFQYVVLSDTDFDPDLPVEDSVNREAARQRNLSYDSERGFYVDEDGCLAGDEFGQPL
ncbi:hypothetical protein GF386_01500 [Candidatus Pacearchaeota archaeon]|nr:hypothetical protein [Candidatus Pacearchaeota archaeon]MBD3282858.1 hypothetical protein [Candidatus Pacearchaeota archaeon]